MTVKVDKVVKVGDWVECIYDGSYAGQFHGGGRYLITNIHYQGSVLRYNFAKDDNGSTTNGWVAEYFVLSNAPFALDAGVREYEETIAGQEIMEKFKNETV